MPDGLNHLGSMIARAIVDDDQFPGGYPVEIEIKEAAQALFQLRRTVPRRNYN
jgi:hypothetical protein